VELQVCAHNMEAMLSAPEAPGLLKQVAAFALQVAIETRLFINNEFVESKSGEV